MKKALALLFAPMLTGCAVMNAFGLAAVDNAKTANDQAIYVWSTAACATPISAALRNPEIIPALRALCMPAGDVVPADLLRPSARAGRE